MSCFPDRELVFITDLISITMHSLHRDGCLRNLNELREKHAT